VCGGAVTFAEYFLATNSSFCVYLDELLHALSEAKVGCYIGNVFVGALAYADDLVLTAPSDPRANALRKMLANVMRMLLSVL